MDRKEFLKKFMKAGASVCCCGAVMALNSKAQQFTSPSDSNINPTGWIPDLEKRMVQGSVTPDWNKMEKTIEWIKHLMQNMDNLMEPEARIKLMQACGRSCYIRAFGVASEEKPSAETVKGFFQYLEKGGHELKREGNSSYFIFNWGRDHQNPWGLMIRDGYCMCPIVESIPGLSPTYCNCSAGYVKELFERYIGKTLKVEIVETLQTGGKDCIFKVIIPD